MLILDWVGYGAGSNPLAGLRLVGSGLQVQSRDPATILLIELEPGTGSGAPNLTQYGRTMADGDRLPNRRPTKDPQ